MSTLTTNPTREQLEARIAELEAKVERKAKFADASKITFTNAKGNKQTITIVASAKGCVSLYGFTKRFPISLYASVVMFIINNAVALQGWMKTHEAELSFQAAEEETESK